MRIQRCHLNIKVDIFFPITRTVIGRCLEWMQSRATGYGMTHEILAENGTVAFHYPFARFQAYCYYYSALYSLKSNHAFRNNKQQGQLLGLQAEYGH
jgi:hypothetical protein